MNAAPLIAVLVVLMALWRAHVAGAAYIIAEQRGKSNRGAIGQTIASVVFALLAIFIAR